MIRLRLEGMAVSRRLQRMCGKSRYLLHAVGLSLREEGLGVATRRVFNFSVHGKGTAGVSATTRKRDQKDMGGELVLDDIQKFLKPVNDTEILIKSEDICYDVLIPVYNGFDFLEPLLQSVIQNTRGRYRLIIADDASTDDRVRPYLESFAREYADREIQLIFSTENRGFVGNVNAAYAHIENDFVLLNTDTEVPDNWLMRIMQPLHDDRKIASVTPMTNAGELFTFPRIAYVSGEQKVIEGFTYQDIDTHLKTNVKEVVVCDVPSGMGYCMALRKSVVDEVGLFDEEAFGKGYGEETDWCQRARGHGYKHVLLPSMYVYHKHGGTFASDEKKALLEKNLQIIDGRYPSYHKEVRQYFEVDALKSLREYLYAGLLLSRGTRCHVIFDHDLKGGANEFSARLKKKLLASHAAVVMVRYDMTRQVYALTCHTEREDFKFIVKRRDDLFVALKKLPVETVHVSELVSYPEIFALLQDIGDLVNTRNAHSIFYAHDYYAICPNFVLINESGEYCGIPRLPDEIDACMRCLRKTRAPYGMYTSERNIVAWRQAWNLFLHETIDEVIAFSKSSRAIIETAYPDIASKIEVISHDTKYTASLAQSFKDIKSKKESVERVGKKDRKITIGVLGSISYIKGADVINNLAGYLEEKKYTAEIHIIGTTSGIRKSEKIKEYGAFKIEEIPQIVAKQGIDIFLIPSIWPETFSYTTSEVMALDMPVAVFDIGAPAERVKAYKKGMILPSQDPESIWQIIKKEEENKGYVKVNY